MGNTMTYDHVAGLVVTLKSNSPEQLEIMKEAIRALQISDNNFEVVVEDAPNVRN